MRPDDFFSESDPDPHLFGDGREFREDLARQLRAGPLPDHSDTEVGVPLARLVHNELEAYGTSGTQELSNEDMRVALLALQAVLDRLGVAGFNPEFRDFSTFRAWWIRKGAAGSWQARRDLLRDLFEQTHDILADLETRSLNSTLVSPISSHLRTGWGAVDEEISELRRHFLTARTPQDYRAIGNDCVHITEALSRQVYDPERHLRNGEDIPPIDKTKQRISRFVEDAAVGEANAGIRKLAVASIELAQHVKHSPSPTKREAGIAADAAIQLANILRRLAEPDEGRMGGDVTER